MTPTYQKPTLLPNAPELARYIYEHGPVKGYAWDDDPRYKKLAIVVMWDGRFGYPWHALSEDGDSGWFKNFKPLLVSAFAPGERVVVWDDGDIYACVQPYNKTSNGIGWSDCGLQWHHIVRDTGQSLLVADLEKELQHE